MDYDAGTLILVTRYDGCLSLRGGYAEKSPKVSGDDAKCILF
jgi:hypothetical protein